MPYVFPKRRLRSGDVLDPVELNEDLIPAAENYSGRLNAHNFKTEPSPPLIVGSEAYYKTHYAGQDVTIDPVFGSGMSWTLPARSDNATFDANAASMDDDFEWQVIEDLTLTITTPQSVLWVVGWLQYINTGFKVASGHILEGRGCRNQFAVRVDGAIIEETITGKRGSFEQSFQPVKWDTQKAGSTSIPGPGAMRVDPATAIGPEMCPVRVGAAVPVTAGTHTIEIVGRRMSSKLMMPLVGDQNDNVVIYGRRLFILEAPTLPAAGTSASVDVSTFRQEEDFSPSAIGTDGMDTVRNRYNSVEPGALSRGALNNNHLPSALINATQRVLVPSAEQTTDNFYPGIGDNTVTTTASGTTGWINLHNGTTTGASNLLRTDATHPAGFDVTSRNSFIVVLANVRVTKVNDSGSSINPADCARFASIALGYKFAGSSEQIEHSCVAYLNQYQNQSHLSSSNGLVSEDIDVPLLFCLDYTSTLPGANIDYFGVYASTMGYQTGGGVTLVEIGWRESSIMVLQFRA